MKVFFNRINFQQSCHMYQQGGNRVYEYYDDFDNLLKIHETDYLKRDVDTKYFDKSGNITFHMHKDYITNGYIETFKSKLQEYRKYFHYEKRGDFTHYIEKFTSITAPDKNYITEFIRDASDKLIRIIANGKVIELK